MAPLRAYQKAMRKRADRGIIPGYCSIVIWRGSLLHVDAYGFADLERRVPMRTDTLVRLYCMGKSIIATAFMMLVERGECALTDPVAKYIPAFGDVRVVAHPENRRPSQLDVVSSKQITLRHLLTHTSGLSYGKEFNLMPECPAEWSYDDLVKAVEQGQCSNIEMFCDRLAAIPLRRAPGDGFEYSYGIDVIGRVIEVVSGQALDTFLNEAIFCPLGMFDTGFAVGQEKLSRLAALYGSFDTAQALGEASASESPPSCAWALTRLDGAKPQSSAWANGNHCRVLSGGGLMGNNRGGLVSTLNDQARFFLMIARGGQLPGGPRILSENTVRNMVDSDWLCLPDCLGQQAINTGLPGVTAQGPFGWNALGEIGVEADASKIGADAFELGEYGYAGIAETFWSVNPSRELVILWFTQQVDNRSWTTPAANLWLAARKAVQKPTAKRNRTELPAQPAGDATARSRSAPRRRLNGKCKVSGQGLESRLPVKRPASFFEQNHIRNTSV
eukprot:TRINITY_DN42824_c0_g1_i1.p1 TRINITY_DN42824_c0_g1~~TRINITY_DN42824_c0_g1_i1.p1  ORF type:complete len:523 (+),score=54.69 TRINITY_DN42824_c0_g1_i1:66-1571(+)